MTLSPSDGLLHLRQTGYVTDVRAGGIDTNVVIEESILIDNENSSEEELLESTSRFDDPMQVKDESKNEQNDQNSRKLISGEMNPEAKPGSQTQEYKPIDSSSHSDRNSREQDNSKSTERGSSRSSGNGLQSSSPSNRDKKNQPASSANEQEVRSAFIYAVHAPTEEGSRIQSERMANEKTSRELVIQHEIDEGRIPEDMPGLNVGYDIESTEAKGDIRFIEVKSIAGNWGGAGVTLSFSQINVASIKKDAFWLYIVENVNERNPRLYKIQNPVKYIKGFKFNDAWKELAISIEASHQHMDFNFMGITHEDLGTRILHTDRGECWLMGWLQIGQTVQVTLKFDNDDQLVLPLNITKMKKIEQ